jgi:AraC-like DNA-binding protein
MRRITYKEAMARTMPGLPYYAWEGASHPTGIYRPDHVELCLVTAGEGRRIVSGDGDGRRVSTLRAGRLLLFRPLDVHEVFAVGATGMSVICVAFPIETWERFALAAGLDQRPFTRPDAPEIDVDLDDPDTLRPFRRALETFRKRPDGIELMRFLGETIPWFLRSNDARDQQGVPRWLLSAIGAMHEEVNLRAGIARLVALSHVSHTHLWRNTRTYFGISPSDLVTEIRLGHARLLLTSTDDTIATIASRCGFSSPSHFSKAFRRDRHMSPRDFRARSRPPG